MRDRLRLLLQFDPHALLADLRRAEDAAWIPHFVPEHYEGAWSVLPLRAPAGARHDIQKIHSDPTATEFVDTPLLARCGYFAEVLRAFRCPVLAVRLMKLEAGSAIRPHNDHDLAPEYGRARLHIAIVTNDDVDFRLDGTRVVMREGECWFLRLSETHSVANRGATDRVHLVMDVEVNEWLMEQLDAAERAAKELAVTEESALDAFRAGVLRDAALQRRLQAVDERDAFIAAFLDLASAGGHALTRGDIEEAMRQTLRRIRGIPS